MNSVGLIGLCKRDFVDEIIQEIETRSARSSIEWNHEVWKERRGGLDESIKQNGFARFFMYDTKESGGVGIRVAAHFDSFEDIMLEDCHEGKPCLTSFNIKGYEIFDPPLSISTFRDISTGDSVMATQGLGKAFAYVNDPQEVKGKDMAVFVMLVWNTDSWQSPSGSMVNPKKDSYYADYGFGHEEWNFRAEHGLDGSIYGFMMARPANLERLGIQVADSFPVFFYAPHDDAAFLVGSYLRSRHVDQDEIDKLHDFHTKSGIIDERVDELLSIIEKRPIFGKKKGFSALRVSEKKKLIAEELGFEGYKAKRYLACPIDSVVLLPQPILIDRYLTILMKETNVFRKYSRPLYLRAYPIILNKYAFTDEPTLDLSTDEIREMLEESDEIRDEGGTTDRYDTSFVSYTEKSQTKEYRKKEFDLINRFMNWLDDNHGIESYRESRSVDLRFEYNNTSFGVEAKYSEGKMRFPIRLALGQILEYNFFPGRTPKDYWIILLNRKPNKEERKWVESIRIGLPLTIAWESEEGFNFTINPLD
jgi:hypothetical protein